MATSTQDQRTAQQAWDALGDDRAPPLPWQTEADDERWSEQRLEMDLLAGARWPFFRDKTRERAPLNGHSHDQEAMP